MADLHIFGDSYSVDWEHRQKKPWTGQARYYKWLGKHQNISRTLIKNNLR